MLFKDDNKAIIIVIMGNGQTVMGEIPVKDVDIKIVNNNIVVNGGARYEFHEKEFIPQKLVKVGYSVHINVTDFIESDSVKTVD